MILKDELNKILSFLKLIRLWQWTDKIMETMVAIFVLIIYDPSLVYHAMDLVVYIIYLCFSFCYGYMINTFSDREQDVKAKKDFIGGYSLELIQRISRICLVVALLIPFYFLDWRIIVLNIVIWCLGAVYSLPPFRLKERGFLGIFFAILTQRLSFLFFVFIFPTNKEVILYLFGWQLIIGSFLELAHQLEDFKKDKSTRTKTFVTQWGREVAIKWLYANTILLFVYVVFPIFFGVKWGSWGEHMFIMLTLLFFAKHPIFYAYQNAWPGMPLTSSHKFWDE